jgi:hypothetical protein
MTGTGLDRNFLIRTVHDSCNQPAILTYFCEGVNPWKLIGIHKLNRACNDTVAGGH